MYFCQEHIKVDTTHHRKGRVSNHMLCDECMPKWQKSKKMQLKIILGCFLVCCLLTVILVVFNLMVGAKTAGKTNSQRIAGLPTKNE